MSLSSRHPRGPLYDFILCVVLVVVFKLLLIAALVLGMVFS